MQNIIYILYNVYVCLWLFVSTFVTTSYMRRKDFRLRRISCLHFVFAIGKNIFVKDFGIFPRMFAFARDSTRPTDSIFF